MLRALKVDPKEEVNSTFTREEVSGLIGESHREGLLDEQEHTLLTGALQFDERRAADVAIPMAELVTVPRGATVAELEACTAATGFSRFPVVDDGTLVGYVHLKDLLATPADRRDEPVDPVHIRPLADTTTDQLLRSVLASMQRAGAHLGSVRDGDGRLVGVVALEDVLEELVGEVRDATQAAVGTESPRGG